MSIDVEIQSRPTITRLRRWAAKLPWLIIALTIAALAVVWLPREFWRDFRMLFTMIIVAISAGLLALWFIFLSSCSRVLRAGSLLTLVSVGTLLTFSLRHDGFHGDLLPVLHWRWTPTADEQLAARLADQQAAVTPTTNTAKVTARTGIDLTATTPHDYPQFLGPRRLGMVAGPRLARDWSAKPPRQVWRQAIGAGWSAFAVVGDYALTQEQRGEEEAVVCYELLTGREKWVHSDAARFSETYGGVGPRATPTVDEGKVYTLGATGILNCLHGSSGRAIWSVNILTDNHAEQISWGMAGSPLVVGDVIVVSPGGPDGQSLVAYDKLTGRKQWHGGTDRTAYCSPLATTLAGRQQILIFNGHGLDAHNQADGSLLWHHDWETVDESVVNCTQPVVLADAGIQNAADRVLLSSGYGIGSELLQIKQSSGKFTVRTLWKNRNLKAKFANMIVLGEHVYGLDEGILTCLALADGRRCWKSGRYGHGQLLLVGNLLLVQAESGELILVEPTPDEHRELARITALDGKTWNHPVLADRWLLLRNDHEAVCYELPVDAAVGPVATRTPLALP